jgi:hypothetical protein
MPEAVSLAMADLPHERARKRPSKREARVVDVWDENVVTLMVRQIPTKLTQLNFLQEVRRQGFEGLFNFLYVPFDLKKNSNVGYGFINFIKPEYALQFRDKLDGVRIGQKDHKPMRIHPASLQGYEANYNHFSGTKTAQKHDNRISPLFFKPCPYNGYVLEGHDKWAESAQLSAALYGADENMVSQHYGYGWGGDLTTMNQWENCGWDIPEYDPNVLAYSGWADYEGANVDAQVSAYMDHIAAQTTEEDCGTRFDVENIRPPPGFGLEDPCKLPTQCELPSQNGNIQDDDDDPLPDLTSLSKLSAAAECLVTERRAKLDEDPMSWDADVLTVMVRQLPSTYTQLMFLNMVRKAGFDGLFNFVYVPFDFSKRKNIGYGFINFTKPEAALQFRDQFDGVYVDEKCKKPLHIHPALLQGYEANYEHFVKTKIAQMQDPRVSPIFFPPSNGGPHAETPLQPKSAHSDPMTVPIPDFLCNVTKLTVGPQYIDDWKLSPERVFPNNFKAEQVLNGSSFATKDLGFHLDGNPRIPSAVEWLNGAGA